MLRSFTNQTRAQIELHQNASKYENRQTGKKCRYGSP